MKQIEKLDGEQMIRHALTLMVEPESYTVVQMLNKINEIIDALNKVKKDKHLNS